MASSNAVGACGSPVDKESMYDEHRQLMYNQVIARDKKRFPGADRDGDQKLNREEYATSFILVKSLSMHHNACSLFIGLNITQAYAVLKICVHLFLIDVQSVCTSYDHFCTTQQCSPQHT